SEAEARDKKIKGLAEDGDVSMSDAKETKETEDKHAGVAPMELDSDIALTQPTSSASLSSSSSSSDAQSVPMMMRDENDADFAASASQLRGLLSCLSQSFVRAQSGLVDELMKILPSLTFGQAKLASIFTDFMHNYLDWSKFEIV